MIDLLLALQRFAERRGESLRPELAERLRKMPRLGDGHLITIDGDFGDRRGEKDVDTSKVETSFHRASLIVAPNKKAGVGSGPKRQP